MMITINYLLWGTAMLSPATTTFKSYVGSKLWLGLIIVMLASPVSLDAMGFLPHIRPKGLSCGDPKHGKYKHEWNNGFGNPKQAWLKSERFFSRHYYSKKVEGGSTELHTAQSIADVVWLIENGAYVNAQDKNDDTPLHVVPTHLVPVLVHYGADATIKNKEIFRVTAEQNPGWVFARRKCWERVPYWHARAFWQLVKDDRSNMELDEIGHYGHIISKVYQGLTAPMAAVSTGNYEKIVLLQDVIPATVMQQIKALKLIALRKDFERELDSDDDANGPNYIKIYRSLCAFEKGMQEKEFDILF